MGAAEASVEIAASLADVWDLYFDQARWPAWVDGFGSVASASGYPEAAGTLSWRSTPAGRGQVAERVLAHEPRTLHRIAYTDPGSEGELETIFEMVPGGGGERRTKVTQRLSYALVQGGPLRPVLDRLFVRSQMRSSLQRSLSELRIEAESAGGDGDRGRE